MNFFDIITTIAVVWAFIRGWRSGFVAQLLSFVGIIVSIIISIRFCGQAGTMLGGDSRFAPIFGFIATFFAAMIIFALLSKILKSMLSFIGLHSLDTLLGIILSTMKVLLFLSILYTTVDYINTETKFMDVKYTSTSRTFNPIKNISEQIFPHINRLKERIPATYNMTKQKSDDKCR